MNSTFIFDTCLVTPVKYECDSKILIGTFIRSKISLLEKLTNKALVPPTQNVLIMMTSFQGNDFCDSKILIGTFIRSKISLLEKLTNEALVPSTQDFLIMMTSFCRNDFCYAVRKISRRSHGHVIEWWQNEVSIVSEFWVKFVSEKFSFTDRLNMDTLNSRLSHIVKISALIRNYFHNATYPAYLLIWLYGQINRHPSLGQTGF